MLRRFSDQPVVDVKNTRRRPLSWGQVASFVTNPTLSARTTKRRAFPPNSCGTKYVAASCRADISRARFARRPVSIRARSSRITAVSSGCASWRQ